MKHSITNASGVGSRKSIGIIVKKNCDQSKTRLTAVCFVAEVWTVVSAVTPSLSVDAFTGSAAELAVSAVNVTWQHQHTINKVNIHE